MTKKKVCNALLVLLALAIAVVIVFPVYLLIISSFKESQDVFNMNLFPNPSTLTLENYKTKKGDFHLDYKYADDSILRYYDPSFYHH